MTVYSGVFSGTLDIGGDVYGESTDVDTGTLSLDISINFEGDVVGSGTLTDTSVYTVPEPPEYGNYVSTVSGSDTENVGGSIDTAPPGNQVLGIFYIDDLEGSFGGNFNSAMTEITGTLNFSDDNIVPVTLYGQPALPPIISFDSGSLLVSVSEGIATYTLTRGPVPLGDTGSSVLVSTEDGTAIAGTDYDALDQLLVVFAPGQTTATFTVGINPNSADASAKINPDFSVVLSDPINASIGFGTASTTIIEAGDTPKTTTLSAGQTGAGIVVSSGGTLNVASGGTASGTTISGGGSETVSSGGIDIGATVSSGGTQTVESGGIATSTTVAASGTQTILDGGTASDTVVSNGGFEVVSSGGLAVGTGLHGGTLVLSSGGTVSGPIGVGTGGGTVDLIGNQSVIAGADLKIVAGAGDDTINALAGSDTVEAGSGDAIVFAGAGDVIENASGNPYFTFHAGTNPSIVGITDGAALIYAGADDTLDGGSAAATVIGAPGDDFVLGAGNDIVNVIPNDETLTFGTGSATVYGGIGDTIGDAAGTLVTVNGGSNPIVLAGSGNSVLLYSGPGDTLTGGNAPMTVIGAAGDDIVLGTGADTVNALPIDETVTFGTGNATVFGGIGDTIGSAAGTDVIFNGGNNVIVVEQQSGAVVVDSAPTVTITGGGAAAQIIGTPNDMITLGSGADTVNALAGNQSIILGNAAGSGTVFGASGDAFTTGMGSDYVDFISGHGGTETLAPGSGSDTAGHDTIADFSQAHGDRIEESGAAETSTIASAQSKGGSTIVTLSDGSTVTLAGITSINSTFFA